MRTVITLLAVLFSTIVSAQERIYCYDALGMAMYCDKYLAAPKLPCVSTLLGTFGDPVPCLERRIAEGGMTHVQIDLIDATCWRNGVCEKGSPRPDDPKFVEARAARVNQLATKYTGIEWWISFGLEHDIKDQAKVKNLHAVAQKACPTCKVINSPFSGASVPGIPDEKHGNTVKAFSVSNDGQSIFDSNSVEYRLNGLRFVFAWFNELNLRYSGEKTFTMPKQRKCKPTADLFRQAFLILKPEESASPFPASCKQIRDVRSDEILKTNAESYCNNDARGNSPLFISKLGTGTFPILDKQGKQIGCFKYYGAFSGKPGYNRYYVGTCSGETPVKLYDEAKGEWAFIKAGNTCIRFNTIRRKGNYR